MRFKITGMSCAACSARVERAVNEVKGVTQCSVSLLTNSMTVEGNADTADIISAVEKAGYGIALEGSAPQHKTDDKLNIIRLRLASSIILLLVLMYFSMGYTMWGFPLPPFFDNNCVAVGIVQLILSSIIMVINQRFFISGFKGLINKAPNMDTLVALGSATSFVYSTYALLLMSSFQAVGDMEKAHACLHEFYFESAAMILTLITVGKMLEEHSKGKTTSALASLLELAPKTATLLKDNMEVEVPVDMVKIGDTFIVKPGGAIPVDGVVLSGSSAVNEAALTGESIPIDKEIGDKVSAATVNTSGFLTCEATKVGKDTTLSQIIDMVSEAASTKAPIAKLANTVSGIFVPVIIGIAALTTIIWLIIGESVGFALARGISVLVISCPCALGLATPVAIMVGNGIGAKNGILFKTAAALEETGRASVVILDKTGTVTQGQPKVTDIAALDNELLSLAASLEKKSEHPLSKAIMEYADENNIPLKESDSFEAFSGNGLSAIIDGRKIRGGKAAFIKEAVDIPSEIEAKADALARQGKTPLLFSRDNELLGIIAVADVLKEDSKGAVNELKNMGLRVIMLTGDNKQTAGAIGKQAGIDEVIAEVLPQDKERAVRKYKRLGKVIMVGDGINDAPALTSADIGIAIGAGTDIAIDAADIVLMKSSVRDIPAAIRLSRNTLSNIRQNLFWAFFYNIIGIPIAAGVLIYPLGIALNPMLGAAAMSLSSFCVVTNALRLNLADIYASGKDNYIKHKIKEEKSMEKTIKIEGMMCPHCEARVKKVLEELPEVIEATPSHTNSNAVIKLSADISDDTLKKVIEAQGYKVL